MIIGEYSPLQIFEVFTYQSEHPETIMVPCMYCVETYSKHAVLDDSSELQNTANALHGREYIRLNDSPIVKIICSIKIHTFGHDRPRLLFCSSHVNQLMVVQECLFYLNKTDIIGNAFPTCFI